MLKHQVIMKNTHIQNIILKHTNVDAPFWKAYRAIVSDTPQTAYSILKERYETAETSAAYTPMSAQGEFTEEEFLTALHALLAEGKITAVQAIATLIEYSVDMDSTHGIKLTTEEVANLYILYHLDSSIAIDLLQPDSDVQEWLEQRSQRLVDFAQLDA